MPLVPPPENARRTAHLLPCTVSHRGAVTAGYIPEGGLRSFRGRKLERGVFKVPDSHEMYAAENASGSVDFALKYWLERDGVFYLHDDAPEDDSPLPKAMQWLEIAAAAYKPVDPAEIAAKRAAKKADEAGEGGTKTS